MSEGNLEDAITAASAAVVKGLIEYEEAKERKAVDKVTSLELSVALRRLKDEYGARRKRALHVATGAVGSYCSKARRLSLESVDKDPRMPRLINYRQRYNALLSMKNRNDVLRRIEQTIDLTDTILAQRNQVDPASALVEVARDYAGKVALLNGIKVVAAEKQVEDETSDATMREPGFEDVDSFEKSIEDAFLSAFRELGDAESSQIAQMGETLDHVSSVAEDLPRAIEAAVAAIEAEQEAMAEALEGRVLDIPVSEPFEGAIVVEAEADAEKLERLSSLVRSSFRTFAQVVRDNGLFSAFAHELSYGACAGWKNGFWMDDFLYDMSEYEGDIPGRTKVADIPDTVEEDEDGDTLDRTIERMEKFNKRRYFGMLDDDFDVHVDAFWYGFKKLMLGVNELFRVNSSEFNTYCNDVAEAAKQAVVELGAASMDERQLEALCKEIEERGRTEQTD